MKPSYSHFLAASAWRRPAQFCIALLFLGAALQLFGQGTQPVQLTDDFASRPDLSGPPAWTAGNLSNATIEVGEPYLPEVSSGQTAWGAWTAPSNGVLTLSADAAGFSPLLSVYAGTDFTNLSLVASNNYLICYEDGACGCHWRERQQISFHVARGQPYQICVDSAIVTDASMGWQAVPITWDGTTVYLMNWGPTFTTNVWPGGPFTLNLQFTPAPRNDDFSHRTRLTGARLTIAVSNAGATKEPGEPDHLGNPGGSSVWYTWTAPASGRVTLSTNQVPPYAPPAANPGQGSGVITVGPGLPSCGNEIDQDPPPPFYPLFAAYTGTAVDSVTPADTLAVGLDAYPNAVEFDVVRGRTYQIAFDGNLGTTGDIPFCLALTTPAVNDNFAHRILLHGTSVVATGYNAGASYQAGAPVLPGATGKTAWWSWTAPASASVWLDLTGSDYAFPVGVFTDANMTALQWVAHGVGSLTFNAVRGRTYQIAVGDAEGLTGEIRLKLVQQQVVRAGAIR